VEVHTEKVVERLSMVKVMLTVLVVVSSAQDKPTSKFSVSLIWADGVVGVANGAAEGRVEAEGADGVAQVVIMA
jgi:hypothetical protein